MCLKATGGGTARDAIATHFHDAVDIHQNRRILIYTTKLIYNENKMKTRNTPEFYTGAPVDPVDLRFREAFVAELWQTLRTRHVVLTAPRRTGKTSVMDYLRDHPENGSSVVSINVQDLTHPADFFHMSGSGLRRATLLQETERALADLGVTLAEHDRRQLFNQLMLDLENDFYIVEVAEGIYDFASGVLKSWWRKYHA